jgi:hypothetical protein
MMPQDYQTKWVNILPQIGYECDICKQGYIEDNSFDSKKGQHFESRICKVCRTKWIKSSFKPKIEVQRPGDKDFHEEEIVPMGDLGPIKKDLADIKASLVQLKMGHQIINENIQAIALGKKKKNEDIPVIEEK